MDAMKNSGWAKASCCAISLIVVGVFATATVFLGIYAFNNPDPEACWVVKGMDDPTTTRDAAVNEADTKSVDITEGYPVDMHRIYIAWFTWGFYAKVAMTALMIISMLVGCWKEKAGMIVGSISMGLYVTNGIVWAACGALWRFSGAGLIAAGDKLERDFDVTDDVWEAQLQLAQDERGIQIKNGRFMKIYLILLAWLAGLFLVGMFVTSLIVCCCDPRKKAAYMQMHKGSPRAGGEDYNFEE